MTVDPAADPETQSAFIRELCRLHPEVDMSVKDSFARLDLSAAGLGLLFDAQWLCRPPGAGAGAGADAEACVHARSGGAALLNWRRIEVDTKLADWEVAWRGSRRMTQRVFLPALLADPRVTMLAGFDEAGALCGGGIAYDAEGVLGLSNVFGEYEQFVDALASLRPPRDMVGYEREDVLTSAKRSGFEVLGGLRVWARSAI